MTAYVLIQTEAFGAAVAHKLRAMTGVVAADDINGPYDAIALARSASSEALAKDVVEPIRRLPEVTRAIVAPLNGDGFREIALSGDQAA
jgi:DNA-binding Lrp family transcriptional regulator